MKKVLLILFLLALTVFQSVRAEEIFKIKGINIDTSTSAIFLNTIGNYQTSITNGIKLVKIPEEHKIYFDISSSILISKKQDLYFNSGAIKQIKISQFTTNPNVVRVVMYFDDNYNIDTLKIGNINNQLVVITQDISDTFTQFYQNTYRDKEKNIEDYYNPLIIQSEATSIKPAINSNTQYSPKELVQIQQAFGDSNANNIKELVRNDLTNNIKLRSKYYINSVTQQNKGFLISGYGAPTIQKPFILTNPTRMVFDIVNSNVNQAFNNKEIPLNPSNLSGDKIKIGRFDSNITRIVVTSEDAKQYLPIFSSDNQSLLIVNPNNLANNTFSQTKTNIIKYKYQKNLSTDDFTLTFDNPVVWGIKRNTDNLYVYFFNASQYNDIVFKNSINGTPYGDLNLALLKNIGIRLTLPLNNNNEVNTYFSGDGKNFRIRTTNLAPKQKKEVVSPTPKGKVIIIDPGHGGTDYGAIRDGINEKDINLDVAKQVQSILERKGFKVKLTRTNDTYLSLEERCNITNSSSPYLFVSIHVNSCMGTEPKGIETHYYHDNSIELANTIHSKMTKAIKTPNRGLFKSKFYVINHTSVPAVLLEIGFISNDTERAELVTKKRQRDTAEAISEGIIEYFNNHK